MVCGPDAAVPERWDHLDHHRGQRVEFRAARGKHRAACVSGFSVFRGGPIHGAALESVCEWLGGWALGTRIVIVRRSFCDVVSGPQWHGATQFGPARDHLIRRLLWRTLYVARTTRTAGPHVRRHHGA